MRGYQTCNWSASIERFLILKIKNRENKENSVSNCSTEYQTAAGIMIDKLRFTRYSSQRLLRTDSRAVYDACLTVQVMELMPCMMRTLAWRSKTSITLPPSLRHLVFLFLAIQLRSACDVYIPGILWLQQWKWRLLTPPLRSRQQGQRSSDERKQFWIVLWE